MPRNTPGLGEEELRNLEAEVAAKRERVAARLAGLRSQMHQVADWRAWYREYASLFLLGAFATGWTLARLLDSRD
jgi:hypothetical protein